MIDHSPMGVFKPIIIGNQIIRLASGRKEIEAAQRLRYQVFYEEMGAHAAANLTETKRDSDNFDSICDHLIVIDRSQPAETAVVGTYRFLRQSHAVRAGGFYSANEYDVTPLSKNGGRIMELGRSCVAPAFRNRHTMQLLWRGIAEYVSTHDIDLMFGCASFPGTDIPSLAQPLSYLHHMHLAPEALRPRALAEHYVSMQVLAPDDIDRRQALALMPPLIKGYLRAGAFVGDGAVIDHQFNTTDVCIIVKTDLITSRYAKHYELGETATKQDDPAHRQPLRKAS